MKPFTVIDAEQRSDAWRVARCGRLTGSRAKDMLATIKSGEAAARRDLRVQLVVERLTGQPQDDGYVNGDMQRGAELEPAAFAAFEAATGEVVQRSGFLAHTVHQAGASLDGHIGDFDGIVEIKCPRSANHLRYLREGGLPAEHLAQITHNLWVSGGAWCDFVSFDPRFPDHLQVFHVRVPRDERAIAAYEAQALAFLAEVEREYQALLTMSDPVSVLKRVVA